MADDSVVDTIPALVVRKPYSYCVRLFNAYLHWVSNTTHLGTSGLRKCMVQAVQTFYRPILPTFAHKLIA